MMDLDHILAKHEMNIPIIWYPNTMTTPLSEEKNAENTAHAQTCRTRSRVVSALFT